VQSNQAPHGLLEDKVSFFRHLAQPTGNADAVGMAVALSALVADDGKEH
jgi:hypothetical protein